MNRHAIPSYVFAGQRIPSLDRDGTKLSAIGLREELVAAITSPSGPYGSRGKGIDSRRMSRVMAFVSEHIGGNFTVADLADIACMSPAHFARSFKRTTGQCPHEFISRVRLTLAKNMLADRHLPISDIALFTGFSSQSNFSRAFRGATGMTPRDWRAGI
jgi:AraC family transcriptional regulator